VIAFGCFGGRHRSVALAEMAAVALKESSIPVTVFHRELSARAIQQKTAIFEC
jgi:RNase adaptor protein for sRNA GlmZ degradation